MKKIRYYIVCCIFLALTSCTGMDDIDNTAVGQNSIVVSTTTGASVIVKSEDTDPEQQVQWIDLFVFNNDDSKTMYHHERIDKTGNPDFGGGQFVVGKKRNEFVANQVYYVYLLANSNKSPMELSRIAALGDLQRMIQQDENLHLTGFRENGNLITENNVVAPELFLMDGVAYAGTSEPQSPSPVILNNGVTTENTNLSATLRRAAAKIIVNIKQGADVEFHQTLVDSEGPAGVDNTGSAIYSFYQLPIDTYIITPENGQYPISKKPVTQDRSPNSYSFIWTPAAEHTASAPNHNITIIGYAYANSWSDTEMTKETSLILNIPMKWNKDDSDDHSKESAHPNSWYKVPLSKESIFERNTCYMVNITINATGAKSKSSAIDLQDIEFATVPWVETKINVGDNSKDPEFLMLNRDTVYIYNSNVDATSLTFSSSSPIPANGIQLKSINGDSYSAYYYNKYNQIQNLSSAIKSTISATAESNVLNGGITINSPIVNANGNPTHYNTIRYLEFEVKNEQGLTATFYVQQYPTIYITNSPGWYSYRDDFKSNPSSSTHATTYHIKGDRIGGIAYTNGTYSLKRYHSSSSGNSTFWGSRYSSNPQANHQGTATSSTYQWQSSSSTSASSVSSSSDENTRMYHIRVTSTSDEYTIGTPKMVTRTENINYDDTRYSMTYTTTDPSEDNANLVSPSFMTASRLGVLTTSRIDYSSSDNTTARNEEMYKLFSYHCANYVEVKQVVENGVTKKVVYDNWRLPTAAELNIIVGLQGKSGENNTTTAIDYLLNAAYYFSASGPVENANSNTSGISVRCVRDAFNEPKPIGLTE